MRRLFTRIARSTIGFFAAWLSFSVLALGSAWAMEQQLDSLVTHLERRAEFPPGTRFRQDITARVLFFTWKFHSDMFQGPSGLESTIHNAPSIVPDTLPLDLIEVVRSPEIFSLQWQGEEDGLVVLQGERINYPGTGPKDAIFWVDADKQIIVRAEASYEWGKLYLEQTYEEIRGHLLLATQRARVRPYGATLEVLYGSYELPEGPY